MKLLLKALGRALARAIATEAGELLSVRRKYHLLQSDMYARLAADASPQAKPKAAPPKAISFSRCAGGARHAQIASAKQTP